MAEIQVNSTAPRDRNPGIMPWAVYILYLAGLLIPGILIPGVILAYAYRGGAPTWLASHYQFQIYTFWIGLAVAILAIITWPLLGLGLVIGVLLSAWLIIRCAYGMRQLNLHAPVPEPESWLFGWRLDG